MKTILDTNKKWEEALARSLLNVQHYEKHFQKVVSYYVNDESKGIEYFLNVVEKTLKNRKSNDINKLCSLLLLKDASEQKSKAFPEALARRRALYSAVYRIAITEPEQFKPKQRNETFGTVASRLRGNQVGSSGDDCISLAIECIVYWRLNYGGLSGNTGKVFRGLYLRLVETDAKMPRKLKFFSQSSERAIQNLERVMEMKKTDDEDEISLDESSVYTQSSQSDSEEETSEARSIPENQNSVFAQIDPMLRELRKLKTEESKMYVQRGLIEKPIELRDYFLAFLSKMKQKIAMIKKQIYASVRIGPTKEEKQLLEDFEREEEGLKKIEIFLKENLMDFSLSETKTLIAEYLNFPFIPETNEKVSSRESLTSLGTKPHEMVPSRTSLTSLTGVNESKIPSFGTLISQCHSPGKDPGSLSSGGTRSDLLLLMRSSLESGGQGTTKTLNLASPDGNFHPSKLFNFSTAVEEQSPQPTIQLKRIKVDHFIPEEKDEIDSPTPVFKNRAGSRQSSNKETTAEDFNEAHRKISFGVEILEKEHSKQIESEHTARTQETISTVQSRAGLPLKSFFGRSITPKPLSPQKLRKELSEIGKSIEMSERRSKISRGTSGSNLDMARTKTETSHRFTSSISVMSSDRRMPTSPTNINFVKELQELKMVTSTLQEENSRLKRELDFLKTSIRKDETQSAITISSIEDEQSNNGGTERRHQVQKSESKLVQHRIEVRPSRKLIGFKLNGPTQGNNGAQNDHAEPSAHYSSPYVQKNLVPQRSRNTINSLSNFHNIFKAKRENSNTSFSTIPVVTSRGNLSIDVSDSASNFRGSTFSRMLQQTEPNKSNEVEDGPEISLPKKTFSVRNSSGNLKLQIPIRNLTSLAQSASSSWIKPSIGQKRTPTPKSAASAKTSFKVGQNAIFNPLTERLKKRKILNVFKRGSLLSKCLLFENDIIKVTCKLAHLEDIDKERRLTKVYLLVENKSKLHIQKFSIEIFENPALLLVKGPEPRNDHIKPKKQQEIHFVVGLGAAIVFSHFELRCSFEQVLVHEEGNAFSEHTFFIPVTYVNFMEGVPQYDDVDVSLPWSSKNAFVLQNSGRFKVNQEIMQSGEDIMEFFPLAARGKSIVDELEQKEVYLCVFETERLGVFIYAKFEWFPKEQEIIVQVASAGEDDQKGAFLIQTLMFLLGE